MKNILILDTGKEWGGGTNSLLELLKRIDKKNYKFTVLFYHNYSKPGESNIRTEIEKLDIPFLLLERKRKPLLVKLLKEAVRIIFFLSRKSRKFFIFWIDYFFRITNDVDNILRLLKHLNIDIIYMNNQPSSNLEGILAAKKAGIKSLLHSRIVADLIYFEIKAVNKWLTKMICVSEGVRESFVKQGVYFSKCIVIHNGIDSTITPSLSPDKVRQKLGVKEDELLIGAVGSLVKRKNFIDLTSSLSYLINKKGFDQLKCLIAGDGPQRAFLQQEIDRNNLSNKVFLTGFKANAISYINALDIFVLTSEREGFPRVILEAMLMGKPVIASRIAGIPELVIEKETGFLFQVGNTLEITDLILKLISSPSLRKDMGKAGRKRVIENFSIEKYITQVCEIFSEIAA